MANWRMAYPKNYLLYHNPTKMEQEFWEVAESGLIATNKESVAETATKEGGIIWCVGREDLEDSKEKRYVLYQRLEPEKVDYNKPGDGFKVTVKGRCTFPKGAERDITDAPYFPKVKKLISLGLQGFSDPEVIAGFEAIYAEELQKAASS